MQREQGVQVGGARLVMARNINEMPLRLLATLPPFRQVAIAWRASFSRPRAIDVLADSVRLCSVRPT